MDTVYRLLPAGIGQAIRGLPPPVLDQLEEIRVRAHRPLEAIYNGAAYCFVSPEGKPLEKPNGAYVPDRHDCVKLLDSLTNHSVYALEEQLRRGFITIRGGHRVGLAGRAALEGGRVKHLQEIASFNIRVAREIAGVGVPVLPYLLEAGGRLRHTLIISPPQLGKTTLLRDLVRLLSEGDRTGLNRTGRKVSIVDERSEIAACVEGVPTFNVGPRSDVMDGCPKAEGIMMLIRSLSPDVIAVDELGRAEDAAAVNEAVSAGVRILATAHGGGYEDAARRPILKELVGDRVFERYVILGPHPHEGARILDADGKSISFAISLRKGGENLRC